MYYLQLILNRQIFNFLVKHRYSYAILMRICQEIEPECRMNFYFVTAPLIGRLITVKSVTRLKQKCYCSV